MPATLQQVLAELTMMSAPELVHDEGGGVLRCVACGHRCRIAEGKSGVCRVRRNVGGHLQVPAGYVGGLNVDPIEKKPFYHVLPGSDALSFGMLGCDFHCSFCQNWISSQTLRDEQATAMPHQISADQLADLAIRRRTPVCVSTYNEPLITADWAMEVFKRLKPRGVLCGFVSNGNATPEVLEYICPYVDLYKVDLKCFDDHHYRKLGGTLQTVLDTIVRLKEMGFWVEVVTLVVPGFNDSDDELRDIARFLDLHIFIQDHGNQFDLPHIQRLPCRGQAGVPSLLVSLRNNNQRMDLLVLRVVSPRLSHRIALRRGLHRVDDRIE